MVRKSIDVGKSNEAIMVDMGARKTERSHEENQERAYIAASRRADRSIEARVQSARQASEIHKKRTGKGFKITQDIVLREEMYEEEDDDLPRSYQLLTAHMQTPSTPLNNKIESFIANKIAFSTALAQSNMIWRSNDINRAFANTFPNLVTTNLASSQNPPQSQNSQPQNCQQPQNISNNNAAMYPQPSEGCSPMTAYSPTSYSPTSYSPTSYSPAPYSPVSVQQPYSPVMQGPMPVLGPPPGPAHLPMSTAPFMPSIPHHAPTRNRKRSQTPASAPGGRRRRSSNKAASCLSATKKGTSSPAPKPTPSDASSLCSTATPDRPMDSIESTTSFNGSSFTTTLPPEARMILDGVGADDVLGQTLASQDIMNGQNGLAQTWMDPAAMYNSSAMPRSTQIDALVPELYGHGSTDPMVPKCNMPTAADDETWQTFINESMWNFDAPQ